MDDVDDLDDLALIDQHELEEGEDGEDLSGSEADVEDDDGEEEAEMMSEEQEEQLKFKVVECITAVGGLEEILDENGEVTMVYIIGDECLRCLRDLRMLLRQDQDNPHRTIAKVFAEVKVLLSVLPLLLKATEIGEKGRKIALATTELIMTMTWPIDLEAEKQAATQREDEDGQAVTTLHYLETTLIAYKSAVLRTRSKESKGSKKSVLSAIMLHVLLPSLSKPRHQRTDRDTGIINMCMHLFRNLLAIDGPVATSLSSVEVIAEAALQSDLIVELQSARILDAILMLASSAISADYNAWNVVTSDCVYEIFAGTKPCDLVEEQYMSGPSQNGPPVTEMESRFVRLLEAEAREQADTQRLQGSSRHSRFNTMINFFDKDGNRRMARGQASLTKSVEQLTAEADAKGKRTISRRRAMQEKGAASHKSPWKEPARKILSSWTERFLKFGFETLSYSVLEDVRKERPKVGDEDVCRTRVMATGVFFLQYFLHRREKRSRKKRITLPAVSSVAEAAGKETACTIDEWPFSLVSQWLEPWALRMAYVRCSSSFEKRRWVEYVVAIELWTTLFKLIDALSKSTLQEDREAAEGILATHFYDQAALDCAKSVLSSYTTQSFSCLRAIIALAQIFPRMLERYSNNNEHMYVKAKQRMRKEREEQVTSLIEDEREARALAKHEETERKFEFQKFQSKMCSQRLAEACITYLARWQEFQDQPGEQFYNVTQVLHRLAVKAGDYRLFFQHKRRSVLKALRDNPLFWSFVQTEAPQAEADLRKVIDYLLHKFDKLSDEEKANWAEGMGAPKPVKIFKMPAELEIKPSRGHLDDVGIAVGLMLEKDLLRCVLWIKSGLEEALCRKRTIIEEERDPEDRADLDEEALDSIPNSAFSRFTDFVLEYDGDEDMCHSASISPEFKLLSRLIGLKSEENDTYRWIWTVPADVLPNELQADIDLIEDNLRRPLDTFGEKYESMVQKIRKAPVRPLRTVTNEHGEKEEVIIRKVKGRRKERQLVEADIDFIEDSDEELENIARLISQQMGEDQISTRHSPSSSSPQQRSEGGSSRDNSRSSSRTPLSSSPIDSPHRHSPPSKQKEKQNRNKTRASVGLFFESDDDEDVGVEGRDDDEEEHTAAATQLLIKRVHVRSDDEDKNSTEAKDQYSLEKVNQSRKRRRALFAIDDEDEDD